MGFQKERRTHVFETPPRFYHDTSSDEEVLPYVIAIDCTATDASTFTYSLNDDVRVVDAWAISAATVTSATAQVQDNAGNAISDAMDIATDTNVTRAGTIDDANWEESEDNNLQVAQASNSDSAYVYVKVVPTK